MDGSPGIAHPAHGATPTSTFGREVLTRRGATRSRSVRMGSCADSRNRLEADPRPMPRDDHANCCQGTQGLFGPFFGDSVLYDNWPLLVSVRSGRLP